MSEFLYCLYDLDGTLTESAPGITRCVQYALEGLGIHEPDLAKLETFVGPPLGDEFRRRYHLSDAQCLFAIDRYRERYRETGIFECTLYPGIRELLSAQAAAGQHLAVASSKPEAFVRQICEHFSIAQYFSEICGAPMDEEKQGTGGKTSKELVVERALQGLGVLSDPERKARTAMVGDRCFDVQGALSNGVIPVGVTYGYGTREELEQAGCTRIAEDAGALGRILLF
ncbi:MAG: HAD hydrolase-like protein [Firmicutes bacterium]|nr:HAD hydrolase-like protein [Bacillota bacterium]